MVLLRSVDGSWNARLASGKMSCGAAAVVFKVRLVYYEAPQLRQVLGVGKWNSITFCQDLSLSLDLKYSDYV
ncbi:hypothetical protein KY290_003898 [Solanum tuberosum]|uniref:Uncharacterized protein n=1 Tax=Solanum tuberosum TaxID=4113 RepID=A0ABQ7WU71_SOLTU|nr:hypothetical protein KY284_001672 [Solanum tuberosum]KAH0784300.1 hypothetical protein KY290_003898 [Solanum tuberosum]